MLTIPFAFPLSLFVLKDKSKNTYSIPVLSPDSDTFNFSLSKIVPPSEISNYEAIEVCKLRDIDDLLSLAPAPKDPSVKRRTPFQKPQRSTDLKVKRPKGAPRASNKR